MGIRIVHDKRNWFTHAYSDHDVPDLETWHSEAYVCGDHPAHYPVPALPTLITQGPRFNGRLWGMSFYTIRKEIHWLMSPNTGRVSRSETP